MSEIDLNHVEPGDPPPSAATWNAILDVAALVRGGSPRGGAPFREVQQYGETVLIKNNSGTDREPFDVLAVSDILISPTDNETEFRSRFTFLGIEPTNAYFGRFVVLADFIADGKIGLAFTGGTIPARIKGTGTHVDVEDGEAGWLLARTYGHAKILYQQAGSDERWSIVRLNDPQLTVIGRTEDVWAKDAAGAVAVRTAASGTEQAAGYTISPVINRFGTIDQFARVWCAWTDGAWHLVSAECQVTTTTTTSTSTTSTSTTSTTTTSTTTTSTTTSTTSTSTTSTTTTTTTSNYCSGCPGAAQQYGVTIPASLGNGFCQDCSDLQSEFLVLSQISDCSWRVPVSPIEIDLCDGTFSITLGYSGGTTTLSFFLGGAELARYTASGCPAVDMILSYQSTGSNICSNWPSTIQLEAP